MAQSGERLQHIKHTILVLSGKGGVGKSTVSTQLAQLLVRAGHTVGLLDIDLCGPSIPRLVGLHGRDVKKSSEGWVPVYADAGRRLAVMSIGFLLPDQDAAVVWRGPKKNAMIKQFIEDVVWGELDYLVIDTPPGTSDEHLGIVEALREHDPDGAVIVTTPQAVSLSDVRKEIAFCRKLHIPILGLFENMSGFVCPHCAECTNIFSSQGGARLAQELQLPFLGRIPIDPRLGECADSGASFVNTYPDSPSLQPLQAFVQSLGATSEQPAGAVDIPQHLPEEGMLVG